MAKGKDKATKKGYDETIEGGAPELYVNYFVYNPKTTKEQVIEHYVRRFDEEPEKVFRMIDNVWAGPITGEKTNEPKVTPKTEQVDMKGTENWEERDLDY